jgi:hypothetical protein
MFLGLLQHNRRKQRTIADVLSNDNCMRVVMHEVSPTLFTEYIMLWIMVNSAAFDPGDVDEDEIRWCRMTTGEYSTRSAYEIQFDGSLISSFPAMIWWVWASSQCKFLSWLMLQNRVWTADRLLLREWPNDYFCPLCQRNLETVIHLFQECLVARQVWMEIGNWSLIPSFHPGSWGAIKGMQNWFGNLCGTAQQTAAVTKGAHSWTIWKE